MEPDGELSYVDIKRTLLSSSIVSKAQRSVWLVLDEPAAEAVVRAAIRFIDLPNKANKDNLEDRVMRLEKRRAKQK